jgi:hypothetical protein
MELYEFIEENRQEIDDHIAHTLGVDENPMPDYEEREAWVMNDEGLYNWAISEGVEI